VARLLALMRVFSNQGTFSDLNLINDVFRPAIGKDLMNRFKSWAYDKQLTPARAFAAALRFPIPGLSIAQQERLAGLIRSVNELKQATDDLSVGQATSRIIENTRLSKEDDDQALDQFFFLAADHHSISSFLSALALNKDTDLCRKGVEKVSLLTMHASKGLEFPMVFIAGCEADLIPYCHPGRTLTDEEEERRLFYVAMTRAKERLFLTWSAKRNVMGRTLERRLSPYVQSVEQRLKENIAQYQRKSVQQQLSLF
jgi:superfamily I DNA/RNA helicase